MMVSAYTNKKNREYAVKACNRTAFGEDDMKKELGS